MLEGLLLALDVFAMLILMRWSIAQERSSRDGSPRNEGKRSIETRP